MSIGKGAEERGGRSRKRYIAVTSFFGFRATEVYEMLELSAAKRRESLHATNYARPGQQTYLLRDKCANDRRNKGDDGRLTGHIA